MLPPPRVDLLFAWGPPRSTTEKSSGGRELQVHARSPRVRPAFQSATFPFLPVDETKSTCAAITFAVTAAASADTASTTADPTKARPQTEGGVGPASLNDDSHPDAPPTPTIAVTPLLTLSGATSAAAAAGGAGGLSFGGLIGIFIPRTNASKDDQAAGGVRGGTVLLRRVDTLLL